MKKNIIALVSPIAIGIICAIICSFFLRTDCYIYRLDFVLTAIITCAATISGFILTSISILVGLSSSPVMKYIRSHGAFTELQFRYTESLLLGIVLIIFCIVLGGKTDDTNLISSLWSVISLGLLVTYLVSITTTGYFLLFVIAKLSDNPIRATSEASIPEGNFRID